jgi:hypothetical protein
MSDPSTDLETVKKQKELEKLDVDIRNAKATIGLERFKAWAALLGPVLTAVTVLGTVYIGYLQISQKSASDEDTNWRQTLTALNDTRPEEFGARHMATLLKPFLESQRYRTLAIGVTTDELPRLRDVGTFKELYVDAFPQPETRDLTVLLDLARRLNTIGLTLQDQAASAGRDEKTASAKRDEMILVHTEAGTLCDPIASTLRNSNHKYLYQQFSSGQSGNPKIPLNDIYFEKCDFSGIDFSDIDLSKSTFDYVILDNAILKNIGNESAFLWSGNIWWTAKEIDADLLTALLERYKPYVFAKNFPTGYRDGVNIKPADWDANIRRLCLIAHMTCTDTQIHVDFPKGS